jgi:hypothetical protein
VWLGEGFGLPFLLPTAFLWGSCFILAMLIMFYKTVTQEQPRTGDEAVPGGPAGD